MFVAEPQEEVIAPVSVAVEVQQESSTVPTEPTTEQVTFTPAAIQQQQQATVVSERAAEKVDEPLPEQMDVDHHYSQPTEIEGKPATEEHGQKDTQPAQKVSEYSAATGEVLEKEKAYVLGRLIQLRILFDTSFDLLLQLRSEGATET